MNIIRPNTIRFKDKINYGLVMFLLTSNQENKSVLNTFPYLVHFYILTLQTWFNKFIKLNLRSILPFLTL